MRSQEVSPQIYFSPLVGTQIYCIWKLGANQYTGTGS